jgi:hypothetical protein
MVIRTLNPLIDLSKGKSSHHLTQKYMKTDITTFDSILKVQIH